MESARPETSLTIWEGVLAPDFTVTALDGKELTLSELRGKRVVVDFWATWCLPCRKEIPHFVRLVNETSRGDLVVVGISSEEARVIDTFAKKNNINYPVASAGKLPPPYDGIQSIPTTFFIDRRGVVQNVLVGYHDYLSLKSHALQKDFEGQPKDQPVVAASTLKLSDHPLQAVRDWSANLPDAKATCVGDWNQTGAPQILVADNARRLHVFGLDGSETTSVALPDRFAMIECGRDKDGHPRLLGYSNWGQKVVVVDQRGNAVWSYASTFGVDGAHWGDLDGDGSDELIVGMNGSGGLHAVGADGKLLWKVSGIGNVWNQAVIPARNGHPGMVFATEAGGTVRVYDAKGKLLQTLRPNGKYCAQMSATIVAPDGAVQAIAIGEATTIAFDPTGTIAWSTTAIKDHGAWRNISFASGDLTGDGRCEWAFLEATGDLVIATAQGEKLCAIPDQKHIESFVIAAPQTGKAILVTLKSGTLQAYRFD